MLFNTVLLITMLINGIVIFLVYRTGLKDGLRIKEGKDMTKIVNLPQRQPKQPQELKKINAILTNIDNYNGTSVGQKEVK